MQIANRVAALCAAGILAGCQTAIYPSPEIAYVDGVSVTRSTSAGTPSMTENVRTSILAQAAALPRSGSAKCLVVDIENFHMKNPGLALLVGDSNRMTASLAVIDRATGRTDATTRVVAMDTAMINGIIGAAQAAMQDPFVVEQRLSRALGAQVVSRLYGPASARRAPGLTPVAAVRPGPVSAEPVAAGGC